MLLIPFSYRLNADYTLDQTCHIATVIVHANESHTTKVAELKIEEAQDSEISLEPLCQLGTSAP